MSAFDSTPTIEQLVQMRLVPEEDGDLRRLYQGQNGPPAIPIVDYLTLRDLCELGQCREVPLQGLLLCLLLAREEGSSCLRLDVASLRRYLATWQETSEATKWAARIKAWFDRGRLPPSLVGAGPEFCPIICVDGKETPRVYFHRYWKNESALREALIRRLKDTTTLPTSASAIKQLKSVLTDVLDKHPAKFLGKPIQLNAEQRIAVALALVRRLLVISGGPGTGKTSTIFTLLRCLLRQGVDPKRIMLAAPTGRAAQRITDFLRTGARGLSPVAEIDAGLNQLAASTLHRLLRYNPTTGAFVYGADNPLPADVVIVDEVSMVDVVLMSRLVDAVPEQGRLILLGDKDQLPSVEGGTVMADLMPPAHGAGFSTPTRKLLSDLLPDVQLPAQSDKPRDGAVLLLQNYRSQKHIQTIAARINAQQVSVVDDLPRLSLKASDPWPAVPDLHPPGSTDGVPGGCWLQENAGQPKALHKVLDAWIKHHCLTTTPGNASYLELTQQCLHWKEGADPSALNTLFARLNTFRVLTVVRDGPFGCEGVNEYLQERWHSTFGSPLVPGSGLFHGAPVMVTSNDHLKQIFNGDVGVVLRDASGGYRAVFPRFDGFTTYALDTLPPHELAFASTVHKGQGSEYDQVLLVLPPDLENRLLTKEIIYTGITRAKHLAVVCSSAEVLRVSIQRRCERESGLSLWD